MFSLSLVNFVFTHLSWSALAFLHAGTFVFTHLSRPALVLLYAGPALACPGFPSFVFTKSTQDTNQAESPASVSVPLVTMYTLPSRDCHMIQEG
jgi:hypothetical protein